MASSSTMKRTWEDTIETMSEALLRTGEKHLEALNKNAEQIVDLKGQNLELVALVNAIKETNARLLAEMGNLTAENMRLKNRVNTLATLIAKDHAVKAKSWVWEPDGLGVSTEGDQS